MRERGRNPGPAFGQVEADDPPMKRCSEGHKYNPYKHGSCPECENR